MAVLPLENISPESSDAYFADGLTEELITSLSKFAAFRVIARTSVMRFKGQQKTVSEISKELGVNVLVEGSVRKLGNKLRVAVQLVDAKSEERIWSREYDREIDDAFAIQSDIAKKIASALKVKIPEHERKAIENLAASVPDAYNLYLNGRYYWNQRTEAGLKKSIEFFNESLKKDPKFALAHTGLADAYGQLAVFEFLRPREAFPKARSEAEAALTINNGLAEAHTSLGLVLFQFEREWSGAEREFKRAIELNANYAPAHQFYADFLKAMGRFEEAIEQMKQALEIDPLSLAINTGFGHVLYLSRQYDRAIEQYQKVVNMDPNYAHARLWFGRPYLQKGMFKEAVAELEAAASLSGRSTMSLAVLGHALASSGNREEAMKILGELSQRAKEKYLPSYWIALI